MKRKLIQAKTVKERFQDKFIAENHSIGAKYFIANVWILVAMLLVLLLPFSAIATTGDVPLNETTFPDAVFRSYVKDNFDSNGDGMLSETECNGVEEIRCVKLGITSVQGIEYFPNLLELVCHINEITELNVSKNSKLISLDCGSNKLRSLDVSHNLELLYLACDYNQIANLDISVNTKLIALNCDKTGIAGVDFSKYPSLEYLSCCDCGLTELDISNNLLLDYLHCDDNQLEVLDISKHTKLASVNCSGNQLTSIDMRSELANEDCDLVCNDNVFSIIISQNRIYDLSNLPGNFDISKASEWNGGSVSGTILTVDRDAKEITYTYDCGNGKTALFKLVYQVKYHITDGAEQIVVKGLKAFFRSSADLKNFVKVLIDGVLLDSKYYTVEEGSTIVTLTPEYTSTLSKGEHTLTIVSKDGEASTTFTIQEKTDLPQTGDNFNVALCVMVMALSLTAVLAICKQRKQA